MTRTKRIKNPAAIPKTEQLKNEIRIFKISIWDTSFPDFFFLYTDSCTSAHVWMTLRLNAFYIFSTADSFLPALS